MVYSGIKEFIAYVFIGVHFLLCPRGEAWEEDALNSSEQNSI